MTNLCAFISHENGEVKFLADTRTRCERTRFTWAPTRVCGLSHGIQISLFEVIFVSDFFLFLHCVGIFFFLLFSLLFWSLLRAFSGKTTVKYLIIFLFRKFNLEIKRTFDELRASV